MRKPNGILLALALIGTGPAAALCSYGVDNARTTIRQEFSDSRWVVRARVTAATDGVVEAGLDDAGMEWTQYRLLVIRSYKGTPPQRLRFFSERNSGGFYMDRSNLPLPAGHDIGGEYLLFLNPVAPYPGQPRAQRGAVFVNYACGQSRPWHKVSTASRAVLRSLAVR